ncbi:MAG: PAS domain S-box protein [Deltaproteobacteria bacterium]|nr:PAS domain S-box protein [Deltaproteobacteria bacterium]
MVDSDLKIPQEELPGRLQTLMFLRVLFVSLLLGASIFIQVKETRTYFGDIQTSHYLLIAFIYFLTFIYVILLKTIKNLSKLAYSQLLVDTFFITAIIYSTGGVESIFSFLYILTIINGSIILYRKGGMIIASSSSILYGLLLDLHYYNVIHPFGSMLIYPAEYHRLYIFYMIVVNIAAFYLVAFLSSYPSEQARKSRVELKAKEDDIIKLEALNEWIIRSITSGLITLDGQGRVILFNPAAEEMFGIKTSQTIGRRVVDILPFLADYTENGPGSSGQGIKDMPGFIDLPYPGEGDERIFIRFSVSPLRIPEGDQKGQILFLQDITAMKRIEEEMKKVEGLALIGELAAGIAHEIRNPMASISGSIQMLKESSEKDDINGRLMDIILREINRLNHLVNDFLLFARPKPANFHEFDLNQLIIDSLELFKNSGKWNENMQVETNFHGTMNLQSDPEQIKQVLWNIFLNASDAMPDEGLLLIGTDMEDSQDLPEPGKKATKITIRDNGEGFSKKALSQLFTPFFTTKQGGSGLGLAIVKRIVEDLNGEIHGRNHPDGGAEITILLRQPPSGFPKET